jgi:hypothetical protein
VANFKRKGPRTMKNRCAMCKFWKHHAFKGTKERKTVQERRAGQRDEDGE